MITRYLSEDQKEKARVRSRRHYWKNRDRCLAQQKEWREAHMEWRASYSKEYAETNKDRLATRNKQWQLANPHKVLLRSAKHCAKQKGLEFNLEAEDIVIPEFCPVLGVPLAVGNGRQDNTLSLDRVDNTKGYIKGNIAVISWRANQLKRDGSLEEFKAIVKYMEGLSANTG